MLKCLFIIIIIKGCSLGDLQGTRPNVERSVKNRPVKQKPEVAVVVAAAVAVAVAVDTV